MGQSNSRLGGVGSTTSGMGQDCQKFYLHVAEMNSSKSDTSYKSLELDKKKDQVFTNVIDRNLLT